MPATPLPRTRLPGSERRARLLDAALAAFAQEGYAATTPGAIARRAGVARTVFYDHFPAKSAAYVAMLDEQNAFAMREIGAKIAGEGSTRARMRETVSAVLTFAETSPDQWKVLFTQGDHLEPAAARAWEAARQQRRSWLVAALTADARRGGVDPTGARLAVTVELVVGGLTAAIEWWREHPEVSRDELLDMTADLYWAGLRSWR